MVRSSVTLCALSATIMACGAIVGIRDLDTVAEPDAAPDAFGSDADSDADTDVESDGAGPVPEGSTGTPTVGGAVHFLQEGAGAHVVLSNGNDDLTVTKNGAFTFAAHVSPGATYAIAVKESPAGQRCFVRNGEGTATTNVTNVEVRCSVVRSSRATVSTQKTTSSATFVDLPDVAPITISNDVAAKVLVSLMVPSATIAGASYNVAIQVDGATAGEVTQMPSEMPIHAVTMALVSLPAGSHTIKPVWRVGNVPTPPASPVATLFHDLYPSTMSAMLLDSLPGFDRVESSDLGAVASLAAGNGGGTTAVTLGATPVQLDTTTAQPALLSLVAPGIKGDRVSMGLRVDGAPFSAYTYAHDINGQVVRSAAPVGVVNLAAGSHVIDTQWVRWADGKNTVTRDSSLAGALRAVLFQNGVQHAEKRIVSDANSASVPLGNTFTTFTPTGEASPLSVSMNLTRPSKVLTTFDACAVRLTPNWPQSAEIALFVNDVQAGTIRQSTPNNIDWGMHGTSLVDVVDVPAGPVTVDVRFRRTTPSATDNPSPIATLPLSGVPGWKTLGLGAIALE